MEERWYQRRSVLGGAAIAAAGVTAGAMADEGFSRGGDRPGAVRPGDGPWTYVPPGGSIQDAIEGGAKAVLLGVGEYRMTQPIVPTGGCTIRGVGQQTRLLATSRMPTMIAIGNGRSVDGVMIGDLVLDCADRAAIGIDLDISGTDRFYKGEPDSVCRLDNMSIHQPVLDGVAYRGRDTQACVTSRVRVRQAGRYGFRVEAPDNWWIACEATTRRQTGSSAGFYVGAAIPGSNGIGGTNNFFEACKAWYCRDYGWHIKSSRNKFIGCEAQDIRSHGWFIESDRNVFTGCVADTAGMRDVGGTAGTADGFHVVQGDQTSLVGCQAFDRRVGGEPPQQRYGFNVPATMADEGRVSGHTGWDNVAGLLNKR
ncbi:right-handed parallel beta-helix repeat-containing protein [Actinomadura rudentiformis]|uniref:Right handed beta helix domain-containing protein n=1 Tax=Actinomadura rudentiformis TaxID=359158 RepID=A0A6H9YND9_9ACTN|nr:right-handed parallel beta-helix repeat-containing protein [Actinomadura rudentiformis]KAB2344032.1 hypothetical protein F8566_32385 [Actinomadura rudentiformis]